MNRILLAVAGFFLFVLLGSSRTGSLVDDVLAYTNQYRQSRGLHSLQMNEDLNKMARMHSQDMANGRIAFGHGGFDERFETASRKIKGFKRFAENVAYGAKTGREVVSMWKRSGEHRKNMLGKFTYIGIGVASDKKGRIYYTQVFAD
jgi:uncharacterized protein YkwD